MFSNKVSIKRVEKYWPITNIGENDQVFLAVLTMQYSVVFCVLLEVCQKP